MRIHLGFVNVIIVAALVVAMGWAAPAATAVPSAADVDVLVIGGTPGGVAAAVAAARMGASVALVEPRRELGGSLTSAWLTTFDMNMGPDGEHLTRGIFLEFYRRLGVSFDRSKAAKVLGRVLVRERGIRIMVDAPLVRIITEGSRIIGVEVQDLRWHRTALVRASQVIDATDHGDIAAASGVPFIVGRAGDQTPERWMQAASLIFRVGNVDWRHVTADIYSRLLDGADLSVWGVNGKAAWGYPDEAARYQPSDARLVLLPLNLALQDDGSVLINALNITGVDGLDPASVEAGMARGVAELPRLIAFLRETVPGFGRASVLDHAPALYVRETRHIVGLYTLTAGDIQSGRVFDDRVAVASYPIDIHPYYPGWADPYPREASEYTLPFRAIVPEGVENLLVPSQAFSATSEAHGSARVVPTVTALGQAAGVAAALCARNGWTPRHMALDPTLVRSLQGALIAQGAYLGWRPEPAARP